MQAIIHSSAGQYQSLYQGQIRVQRSAAVWENQLSLRCLDLNGLDQDRTDSLLDWVQAWSPAAGPLSPKPRACLAPVSPLLVVLVSSQ